MEKTLKLWLHNLLAVLQVSCSLGVSYLLSRFHLKLWPPTVTACFCPCSQTPLLHNCLKCLSCVYLIQRFPIHVKVNKYYGSHLKMSSRSYFYLTVPAAFWGRRRAWRWGAPPRTSWRWTGAPRRGWKLEPGWVEIGGILDLNQFHWNLIWYFNFFLNLSLIIF